MPTRDGADALHVPESRTSAPSSRRMIFLRLKARTTDGALRGVTTACHADRQRRCVSYARTCTRPTKFVTHWGKWVSQQCAYNVAPVPESRSRLVWHTNANFEAGVFGWSPSCSSRVGADSRCSTGAGPMSVQTRDETLPRPPRLRPSWQRWMWLAFAVATVAAIIIGFLRAGRPFWH